MAIYILTLNWNGEERLKKLIPLLSKNMLDLQTKTKIPVRWLIKDNGSTDKSVEEIQKFDSSGFEEDPVDIYMTDHNRDSFAKGVNTLATKAKITDKDFIVLLNNDIEFLEEDSLFKMFSLMRKTKAGVVGARLLYSNSNLLQHAGVIFSKKYNYLPFHFRPKHKTDKLAEKNRWFQAVTAACCFVRGSSFNRINGMDEGFKWAFEDVDMCLAIGQKEKIAYCGNVKIYHEESASLKKNPANKLFLNQNINHFRKKWAAKYSLDLELYEKDKNHNEI